MVAVREYVRRSPNEIRVPPAPPSREAMYSSRRRPRYEPEAGVNLAFIMGGTSSGSP